MDNTFLASMTELFERDLNQLETEIAAYPNDELLWLTKGDVKNSAGNLALHLCGNLNHYIGATLGNTGYLRQRTREFSDKHLDRGILLQQIRSTKQMVTGVLTGITSGLLEEQYPIQVWEKPMTTQFFIMHLHGHLTYHLGQINYLRRTLIES